MDEEFHCLHFLLSFIPSSYHTLGYTHPPREEKRKLEKAEREGKNPFCIAMQL
jgi:hypothetical protein